MVAFLTVVLVIACVLIVVAILMQSGKGGGLAEGFSSAENILGTQTNMVMVKVTAVLVTIFIGCCLGLACLSTSQEQSLMKRLPQNRRATTVNVDQLFNQTPAQTITINAAEPEPESVPAPVSGGAK